MIAPPRPDTADDFLPIVIAPTYDNAGTLGDVLRRIDQCAGIDVLVVDDGSADATRQILESWLGSRTASTVATCVEHDRNRGKAAALQTGFAWARGHGYTHALTIDTDDQLEPEQIPELLETSRTHPQDLIVGRREPQLNGYPRMSRLGRWACNVLVGWESGAAVTDSQCGFRVYPLGALAHIGTCWRRYAFETEVLTRLAWAGVAIREVPVRCTYDPPGGRVSHFRPWRDSLMSARMNIWLLLRSALPIPVTRQFDDSPTGTLWLRFMRWINPARAWRLVRDDPSQRTRFAAGLGVGVFIGNLPVYGGQTALSLFAARVAKLNPLSVIVGSHVSTPPLGPLLIVLAISIGHWLLHESPPSVANYDPHVVGYVGLIKNVILEWTLGGILCGAAMGAATFAVSRLIIFAMTFKRRGPVKARPAAAIASRKQVFAEVDRVLPAPALDPANAE